MNIHIHTVSQCQCEIENPNTTKRPNVFLDTWMRVNKWPFIRNDAFVAKMFVLSKHKFLNIHYTAHQHFVFGYGICCYYLHVFIRSTHNFSNNLDCMQILTKTTIQCKQQPLPRKCDPSTLFRLQMLQSHFVACKSHIVVENRICNSMRICHLVTNHS